MTVTREDLLSATRAFGTPLYLYDADLVVARYREMREFIDWPRLTIHYAMKANYSVGLLRALNEVGACLDTVSPAEVLLALRLGFDRERLLYTANNMTDEEMHQIQGTGILLNIDSLSRLERFGRAFPASRVCLRFNPDVVDGEDAKVRTGGDLTKFGILLQDVEKVKEIVARHGLTVVGLHEHTGSGLTMTESVYQSMRNLMAIATRENFPALEFLDFGGGFKAPYRPEEARVDYPAMGAEITRLFAAFCQGYGRELEMRFEPGKYVVAEAGYLIVAVNTLKDNNGRAIVGCNSGFPHLIRPVLYDAYHHIVNLTNPDGRPKPYDVCGNICETGDRFAEQREIAEIREGDLLAIENAGAYCYSMGSVYNLRAMPAEAMVYQGRLVLARRRLDNRELVEGILRESVWETLVNE
uniref:Diaminopimelate decarboxylase n=1 Tax=Candidatus Kentrum sp. MB TaxID=2138164 RepID=A0A450Y2Z0_9GAMM|nr:MAG: diaminopimelate decarboxylase [Candidatus Kentron sp. MB]VFK35869.1 MAG: diaminopimelate decarboxylase [Candidatus Kentron sp. MB]VFK77506.1 MAG: diaminopimelate decarboxylase [Candidatus Kentron sp. MB]